MDHQKLLHYHAKSDDLRGQMDVVYDMYMSDGRRENKTFSGGLNNNLLNGIVYHTREGVVYVVETSNDIHLMDYKHYTTLMQHSLPKSNK